MNRTQKIRYTIMILFIGICYLLAFSMLESRKGSIHVIQCAVDQWIPFCEYFIVPYLLWFLYVAVTGIYFLYFNNSEKEFKDFMYTLLAGMVVFLVISYIYPNGQILRPNIADDTLFKRLVLFIYQTDTPTNILPSLHVFYSVACDLAWTKSEGWKEKKGFLLCVHLLTLSIILSTMFLKQHSFIDVAMALIMNGICFQISYGRVWNEIREEVRQKKKKIEEIKL